ncbi:RcnB family protein [Phenylobacterium sp.]|jgi:Ni/Co efflux regulator RcnB|uniref:RcnB family protein n=1 Tax=Phenylobacterium sp. TaxID=1871053 RepID=UPI002F428343
MRRLICLLAAVAAVASPLATAGRAMADDHHGRHEQGSGRQGMGRIFGGSGGRGQAAQPYRPQEYRPQEYRQPEYRQAEPRGQENRGQEYRGQEYRPEAYRGEPADPRYGYRGGAQAYGGARDPRYDPRVYAPPPSAYSAAPRRGGYMGPEGAPVVGDYAAKRLRPPPPGYDWMQTPRGYALVSRQTHQVFDVVPY